MIRRNWIKLIADALQKDYVTALELISETNKNKLIWYKTFKANYNTETFCLASANDFFDFSKEGIDALIKDKALKDSEKIIDVGAGVGLTTLMLREKYREKYIFYNNLRGLQSKVAKKVLSSDKDFILKSAELIDTKVDTIICFEFLEHFENPCKIFETLVRNTESRKIIMQNSFGGFGYGHFPFYKINGERVRSCDAKNAFNEWLIKKNYKLKFIKKSRVIVAEKQ